MKRSVHDEEETTGAIGALGFVLTLLASLGAFCIAGMGMFDSPPKTRIVLVEKSKAKPRASSLSTSPFKSDLELSATADSMPATAIVR
jgi:hypothetical protein